MKNLRKAGLALLLVLGLFLTLGSEDSFKSQGLDFGGEETIRIAYSSWDDHIATSHVAQQVLAEEGIEADLVQVEAAIMFSSVADGEADVFMGAWLPGHHADYYDQYGDRMVDLGPNSDGVILGLVVPTYMEVDSVEDLTDEAGGVITGIEPGAGMTQAAERAMVDYPSLNNFQLQLASTGAMTTALRQAVAQGEEIIVTGWKPHWMFAQYDLKFLEDPRGSFGEANSVHTLVREGFREDHPRACEILDKFYWDVEEVEKILLDLGQDVPPEEAAAKWIEDHRDIVETWLD